MTKEGISLNVIIVACIALLLIVILSLLVVQGNCQYLSPTLSRHRGLVYKDELKRLRIKDVEFECVEYRPEILIDVYRRVLHDCIEDFCKDDCWRKAQEQFTPGHRYSDEYYSFKRSCRKSCSNEVLTINGTSQVLRLDNFVLSSMNTANDTAVISSCQQTPVDFSEDIMWCLEQDQEAYTRQVCVKEILMRKK